MPSNLPLSRSITLNPGDPFPSALGCELQDAVIASAHAVYPMEFAAHDFEVCAPATRKLYPGGLGTTGGYIEENAGSSMIARATIKAWPGGVISKVEFIHDITGGAGITFRLVRQIQATSQQSAVWTFIQSTGSGISTYTNTSSTILLAGSVYWLEAGTSGGAQKLYGATVNIQRPL